MNSTNNGNANTMSFVCVLLLCLPTLNEGTPSVGNGLILFAHLKGASRLCVKNIGAC